MLYDNNDIIDNEIANIKIIHWEDLGIVIIYPRDRGKPQMRSLKGGKGSKTYQK